MTNTGQIAARPVYRTRMFDSTRWDEIALRDDDVVIATWAKSGTTLTQQLVSQIIGGGDPALNLSASFWIDVTFQTPLPILKQILEAQTHRRFLKSHLPFDGVPHDERLRYIFIGRDARDVIWSAYDHMRAFTPAAWEAINAVPSDAPPWKRFEGSARDFYLQWLATDCAEGFHDLSFWDCVRSWWDQRDRPNVLLLHYADLIVDLAGEARRVADFLDVELAPDAMEPIVQHCQIGFMREQARGSMLDVFFEKGPDSFMNKGVNGRWRDQLSAAEIALADEVAARRLPPDCAAWLRDGRAALADGATG